MNAVLFNVGLPMILPAMYLMVLGLIPIVLIEALVISKQLRVSYLSGVKSATLGNIVSTAIGIPLTWLLLLVIEMGLFSLAPFVMPRLDEFFLPNKDFWRNLFSVTVGAPWLVPFGNQDWMVFAAMGVLLVPFFFASWAVEYQVAKRRLTNELCELRDSTGPGESFGRDTFTREIRSAVRNANLISYALLGLFVLTLYLVTSG